MNLEREAALKLGWAETQIWWAVWPLGLPVKALHQHLHSSAELMSSGWTVDARTYLRYVHVVGYTGTPRYHQIWPGQLSLKRDWMRPDR